MEEGMVMQKTQLKRKLLVVVHVCSRKTCVELGAGWSLSILKHTRKHTHTHTHTQDSRLLQGRRPVAGPSLSQWFPGLPKRSHVAFGENPNANLIVCYLPLIESVFVL